MARQENMNVHLSQVKRHCQSLQFICKLMEVFRGLDQFFILFFVSGEVCLARRDVNPGGSCLSVSSFSE